MSILKTFLQKNKGLALLTFVMICLEIAGTLGVPKFSSKADRHRYSKWRSLSYKKNWS